MNAADLAVDGLVSAAQLHALGHDAYSIRQLCSSDALRRIIRGWYAVRGDDPPWEGADRFESAHRRHRLLTLALLRSFEGRVAASRQSAVALLGGRLWKSDLDLAHVDRAGDDHSRHRRRAIIHPQVAPSLLRLTGGFDWEGGYLCVPPAIAAVQVGLGDSGRGFPAFPLESLVVAEGLLWDGIVSRTDLDEAVGLYEGVAGIRAVREVLMYARCGSESVGETRLMYKLRVLGYRVEQQMSIPGTPFRVDGMLQDEAVCIEFDGMGKYGRDPAAAGLESGALRREKERQDVLARLGYGVARFTWDVLGDLKELQRRVELARAVARRGVA